MIWILQINVKIWQPLGKRPCEKTNKENQACIFQGYSEKSYLSLLFFSKQIMQFHTDPEYLEHLSLSEWFVLLKKFISHHFIILSHENWSQTNNLYLLEICWDWFLESCQKFWNKMNSLNKWINLAHLCFLKRINLGMIVACSHKTDIWN